MLNIFEYVHIDSPSYCATLKSSIAFFLVGMLVLKCATSLAYRSLNPSIEFDSKLLYKVCTHLSKVIESTLHIESWSWMIKSKLLHIFLHAPLGCLNHHSCPSSISWKYSLHRVECLISIWTREKLSTDRGYRHSLEYACAQTIS